METALVEMRHMTCETRHGPVTKRGNGTTVDVLKGWCRMTDQPRSLQKVLEIIQK